jgi:tripartite-type tricarboxylate transporter receptor subunit TctC
MLQGRWTGRILVLVIGFCFLMFPSSLLIAQEFPSKAIKVTIGMAAGDTIDVLARAVAGKAERILGQPLVVSNKPGSVGGLVAGAIANEKPDGYSLGIVTNMTFHRTLLLSDVPYALKDFAPVMTFATAESGLAVREDSPWRTFKELVAYAKSNPGKIRYGSLGTWSYPHASMELVALQEGIQWTHIPFRGSHPAMAALLGDHVEVAGVGSASYAPHVKAGAARLLATNGETRGKEFPNVPTIKELGYDIVNDGIFLVIAPKGTPLSIVKKLDNALKMAMDDEYGKLVQETGAAFCYKSSEETERYLAERHHAYLKLIDVLKMPKE